MPPGSESKKKISTDGVEERRRKNVKGSWQRGRDKKDLKNLKRSVSEPAGVVRKRRTFFGSDVPSRCGNRNLRWRSLEFQRNNHSLCLITSEKLQREQLEA